LPIIRKDQSIIVSFQKGGKVSTQRFGWNETCQYKTHYKPVQLKSGIPYSLIRYGLVHNYPKLDKEINTDVLVIGGGISGALVSYELTGKNIPNVVIDRRSIGVGSTCASSSLLQYELDVPLFELSGRIGKKNAESIYLLCRKAIYGLLHISKEIGFAEAAKKGSLYFTSAAKDRSFLKSEYTARKACGLDVSLLDRREIMQLAQLKTAGGILSADAAQMDSYLFTHALHQYNMARGARVFDRTEATAITNSKNRIKITTATRNTIYAKKVVHATGYEMLEELKPRLVIPSITYAIISEASNKPIKDWNNELLFWNTAKPYLYMRSTSDNRILIGGRDAKFNRANQSQQTLQQKKKELERDMHKLFPQVPFTAEFSWSGVFASTRDGLPYIDSHKPNEYLALGYGGNGITFSLIAAQIISAMILGKKNRHMQLFALNR
jgi:glycine/D-amino acid oxidase-like deaminating enzyme